MQEVLDINFVIKKKYGDSIQIYIVADKNKIFLILSCLARIISWLFLFVVVNRLF